MDSPPSSSTLAQSLWYQPSPTQLSTLCEVAPMSSNSRDDAGVSEERVDTVVVPTKARKCNQCKKMKCRHSRASVSSSTKSKVSNPGGHRLDVSPATAVPLPSIEEGYNAPMTTIENNPPLDSSPNRENIDTIAVGSPTLAQEDGTFPDPDNIRYEVQHATSPPTQHEQQLLNMPDSRPSNPATRRPPSVSEIPNSDATENAECQPLLSSSVPAWDSFVLRRPQLLRQAIRESVGSGTFHDVDLYAYSTRSKILRSVSAPTVVHARISFLEAPSSVLKDLLTNGRKQLSDIPSTIYDHKHLDDSDLEDDEPEAVDSMDKASDISDMASNISAFDLLDSPQFTAHSVINTGARGVECDSTVEHVTHEGAHREVIYVPFGAARTWRALVLYLYDGSISFSPLQTSAKQSKGRDDVSCSPKSMYSLAKKLELDELAKVCEEAIITDLRASNIIKELFNDFTWRHPAILGREVIVFKNYSQDVRVRSELKQTFQDIASGKLPRRDVVLSALFDNLLPPVL